MTSRKLATLSRIGLILSFLCAALPAASAPPTDRDADGMPAEYEDFFGLDDRDASDAMEDPDGDGAINLVESQRWSDPFVADSDMDGWLDSTDQQPVSRAVMNWGLPQYTTGNEFRYPAPAWWAGARKDNGDWITPQQLNGQKNGQKWEFLDAFLAAGFSNGWNVAANRQPNTGRLIVTLDRANLVSNIVLQATVMDTTNSTLYVDLLSAAGQVVASDVVGNLLLGNGGALTVVHSIPLAAHPSASAIALRRGGGDVTVVRSVLYVDNDGDGLDDAQEAQLGTSDFAVDTDGDGISDPDELARGTSPTDADSDDDGLSDGDETGIHHTDPLNPDTDGDGLSDGAEVGTHHTDPLKSDTDGDGLTDSAEVNTHHTNPTVVDTDGDGLADGIEINIHHTDPLVVDTDGDGIGDGAEVNEHQTDPLAADTDGDGLSDGDEVQRGTNPRVADTDGDGLSDGAEVNLHGTDPKAADSDGDGLVDGAEIAASTNPLDPDSDDDGLSDGAEVNEHHSDPLVVDSDGDGIPDGDEVLDYSTDPASADTDEDGLSDWDELFLYGTLATNSDTDGDGMGDGWEYLYEFNPFHAGDGAPAPIGEYGMLSVVQTNALEWRAVSFQRPLADPVVVVGPLTYNGTDPAMARVRGVTPTGFEFKLDEWDYLDGATVSGFGPFPAHGAP